MIWITLAIITLCSMAAGDLTKKNHLTHRASEKPNDLSCFTCHSMEDGDRCYNLPPIGGNFSKNFVKQCRDDRRMCMIKRYSYTTSTENTTSRPELWAMERNCSNKCEAGCIIIGERVKLYACTACCDSTLCNNGTGSAPRISARTTAVHILPALSMIVIMNSAINRRLS